MSGTLIGSAMLAQRPNTVPVVAPTEPEPTGAVEQTGYTDLLDVSPATYAAYVAAEYAAGEPAALANSGYVLWRELVPLARDLRDGTKNAAELTTAMLGWITAPSTLTGFDLDAITSLTASFAPGGFDLRDILDKFDASGGVLTQELQDDYLVTSFKQIVEITIAWASMVSTRPGSGDFDQADWYTATFGNQYAEDFLPPDLAPFEDWSTLN